MPRTKVLVVDDSAVMRGVMSQALEADPALEVLMPASDPLAALERMKRQWPDVILLDLEMPHMDGLTFLRRIMAERPTPVVVCSTMAVEGAPATLEALAAGAVSVFAKPRAGLKQFLDVSSGELVAAVKLAARARVRRPQPVAPRPVPSPVGERHSADVILAPVGPRAVAEVTERVVALGASTGGTQAIEEVLRALPRTCPGLVIVQHMPEKFTEAFAARLDGLCQILVKEAATGDPVAPGRALIAPGGRHLLLRRSGAQYFVEVVDGPPVNRHRPAVDVLFRSVAQAAGKNALGVLLTGMGDDGAAGLLELRNAGARTVAQDEETSVVYGMPKEACKRGAVERSLPLGEIAREILRVPGQPA